MVVRSIVALTLAALATWLVFLSVRAFTTSPAPAVHVRWKDDVSERARHALEEQFTLANPRHLQGRTWKYDLLDSRPSMIRAIVEHPTVADTHDIDRERFRVAVTAEPGSSRRWAWHRWGTAKGERLAERTLQTVAALSVLVCVWIVRRSRDPRSDREGLA